MRFPTVFTRVKPAAPPAKTLGGDVLPVDGSTPRAPNPTLDDNVLFSRFVSVNGWPAYRVAVTYQYVGAGSAIALPAVMAFYESTTNAWYQIGASQNMQPGQVTFFDCVSLLDTPHVGTSDLVGVGAGSIGQVLIVSDPGSAPNGTYKFALAPDLTSVGNL